MNIVVLGPQGSGKGTQSEMLSRRFNLEHIDMGGFLREVAKTDTLLGREVYHIQNVTKTLVPSRILREVFTIKLNSIPRKQGIVFDGFPRNVDQSSYFEEMLREFGRNIDWVVFVDISKQESLKRIGSRFSCESCREAIVLKSGDDKHVTCPKCSGALVQRVDDTEEGIEKRLQIFKEETLPVIEYFEKENLVLKINGEQSAEKVFNDILKYINCL